MKKERLWKIVEGTGFVMLMVGCCAMDSESLALPILMVLVGLSMLMAAGKRFEME